VSLFSSDRLATKRGNGSARTDLMAENAWNRPRMCLLGASSKNGHPTPTSPQILKMLPYKSRFSWKTRINFGVSATKIPIRIGNSPWGFRIWG